MSKPEVIYGRNPVISLLETNRKRINKIFIAKGIKYDEKIKNIIRMAREYKINVQEIPRDRLDKITQGVHQGVAASVSPVEYTDFNTLLENIKGRQNSLIVILDKIEDPHNFGSIIRSSASAGVDAIIIAKRRSAPVTPAVEKASAGTVALVPIVQVSNISNAIEKLKDYNFWIIGAEADAEKYYFEQDYDMNCALVMGGEDQGISPLVKKNCDILTSIPMENNVNSLNVANSASILIYEIVRQRILKNKK